MPFCCACQHSAWPPALKFDGPADCDKVHTTQLSCDACSSMHCCACLFSAGLLGVGQKSPAPVAAHGITQATVGSTQTPQPCLLQHVDALTPAHREAGLPPVWDLVYQAGLQLACTAGCEELMGSLAASCQHYAQVRVPWHCTGFDHVGCKLTRQPVRAMSERQQCRV